MDYLGNDLTVDKTGLVTIQILVLQQPTNRSVNQGGLFLGNI